MSRRSKRYQSAKQLLEAGKRYQPVEAIAVAKRMVGEKANQALELHLKLGIDPKKADQMVRGTVDLPHGTGKSPRVAAFVKPDVADEVKAAGAEVVGGEELIKELKTTGQITFDVAVATPALMKPLAQIAKLLGQRGLMPNPKDETVTTAPAKAVAAWKKGRATFRSDETGNVHLAVGRIGFADDQLQENVAAALDAVKRTKPAAAKGTFIISATLATTFGPGIPLAV